MLASIGSYPSSRYSHQVRDPQRRYGLSVGHSLTSHYHGEWGTEWEDDEWEADASWWAAADRRHYAQRGVGLGPAMRRRHYEMNTWEEWHEDPRYRGRQHQDEYVRGRPQKRSVRIEPHTTNGMNRRPVAESGKAKGKGDRDKVSKLPKVKIEEEWPTLVNQVVDTATKVGKAWSYIRKQAENDTAGDAEVGEPEMAKDSHSAAVHLPSEVISGSAPSSSSTKPPAGSSTQAPASSSTNAQSSSSAKVAVRRFAKAGQEAADESSEALGEKSSKRQEQFSIGELVEMRDTADEEWSSGVVTKLHPFQVRFAFDPSENDGFRFDEVRKNQAPTENATSSAAKAAKAARRFAVAAAEAAEAAARSADCDQETPETDRPEETRKQRASKSSDMSRSETEEKKSMEICECGAVHEAGVRFCSMCGASLDNFSELAFSVADTDDAASLVGSMRGGRWRSKKEQCLAEVSERTGRSPSRSRVRYYEEPSYRSHSQARHYDYDDYAADIRERSIGFMSARCKVFEPGDTPPYRILQRLMDEVYFLRKTFEKADAAILLRNVSMLIAEAQEAGLQMDSSMLAAVASHCARFGDSTLLGVVIDYGKRRLWAYTGREVAGLAWAAARMRHFDIDFFCAFAGYCASARPDTFEDFQDVTKAAKALAEIRQVLSIPMAQLEEDLLEVVDYAMAFHGLSEVALEHLARVDGRTSDVAEFAKALAAALHERPHAGGSPLHSQPVVEQTISRAVFQVRSSLHQANAKDVASITVTVAAAWEAMEHMRNDELLPCMKDVGQAARFRRYDYSPQDLATVAHSFSKVGYADLAIADVLNEQTWANIVNFTWQNFITILGAVLRMQGTPRSWDEEPFVRNCMSEITSRDLTTIDPEEACKLVQILLKLSSTLCVVALGRLFDEAVQRRRLWGFNPRSKAVFFQAVVQANLMEAFSEALISAFSPSELMCGHACDVLWALAKSWEIVGDLGNGKLKHEACRLVNDIIKAQPWEDADAMQVADAMWAIPIVQAAIWKNAGIWASLWKAVESVEPSSDGMATDIVNEIVQFVSRLEVCPQAMVQRGQQAIAAFVAKAVDRLYVVGQPLSQHDARKLTESFAVQGMELPRGLQQLVANAKDANYAHVEGVFACDSSGVVRNQSASRGNGFGHVQSPRKSPTSSRRLSSPELAARHRVSNGLGRSDRGSRTHLDVSETYESWDAYGTEVFPWSMVPAMGVHGMQDFFPPMGIPMNMGLPLPYIATSAFESGIGASCNLEAPGYWGPSPKGFANPYCSETDLDASGIFPASEDHDSDNSTLPVHPVRQPRPRFSDEVTLKSRASSAPVIEEVFVARDAPSRRRGTKSEDQTNDEHVDGENSTEASVRLPAAREAQTEGLRLDLHCPPRHFVQTKNTFLHIDVHETHSQCSDSNSPPPLRRMTRSRSCDDIMLIRPRRQLSGEDDEEESDDGAAMQRSMSATASAKPLARPPPIRPPPGLRRNCSPPTPAASSMVRDVPPWLQRESLKNIAKRMSGLGSRSVSRHNEVASPGVSPLVPHATTDGTIAPPTASSTVLAYSSTSATRVASVPTAIESKITKLRRLPPGLKPRVPVLQGTAPEITATPLLQGSVAEASSPPGQAHQ